MKTPAFAYDFETYLFVPGAMAPPHVCASTARVAGGDIVGSLLSHADALPALRAQLQSGETVAFANAPYDLAVAAQADPTLFPLIFKALREGRVHDVLLAQVLDSIYRGTLGDPLVDPSTGKPSKRYSLAIVTHLVLGRADAKDADAWRKSYALLDGIPVDRWPEEARVYPVHDARNTLEVAIEQVAGKPGSHSWDPVPQVPGQPLHRLVGCSHCALASAPAQAHMNLGDLAAQVEVAFALHLGACWSLRADPAKVERLAVEVERKHAAAVERFQKKGWVRSPCLARCGACPVCRVAGTEDQAAVKRAIAAAYGAAAPCPRCAGAGRVKKTETVPCRGVKLRGRYQGCAGFECPVCAGVGEIVKSAGDTTCKAAPPGSPPEDSGCDGTGFDLSAVPMLPRTDKGGVSTDRDTTMESGDDDLFDYGENEFEKSRTTYLPWLRAGVDRPLKYSTNALVGTGRCSLEGGPFHQLPRSGKERECIRARGEWCGHPVEMVIGSTDYEAGELCLDGDTRILTSKGYRPIRDLVGASVRVASKFSDEHSFVEKPKFHKATAFRTGRKDTVKITTVDGRELICTRNHPVLVQTVSGKRDQNSARNFRDYDIEPKPWRKISYSWTEAKDVAPGDFLVSGYTSISSEQEHYRGTQVLSVEPAGKREVFNLEVPATRHYVAEGLVVHNCALAQYTYWLFDYSQMREAINRSGKPGILHSDLAAEVLGVSLDEFLGRLKAKDKQAKDFRQMSKCFHPDTEILTRRRGWVRIADLTLDDEVASAVPRGRTPAWRERDALGRFPPASGAQLTREAWRTDRGDKPTVSIEWVRPTQLTTRAAADGLLHLKNESINLRVTPDHRMLTYGSTGVLRDVEARDFGAQRGWFNAGMCDEGEVEVDERLLRLAVATQADGNYIVGDKERKKIRFGFAKQRKIDRLVSLLRAGEYERVDDVPNGKNRPVTQFCLSEALSESVKALLDRDKTLPWWWIELRPDLRDAALDEAAHWDSHRGPAMRCYYFSTAIEKNADVLQALASITNRKATRLQDRPYATSDGSSAVAHSLSVKSKYDTRGESVSIARIKYDGPVVCLSVPSSYVLVRDRGVPVITGQCINFGVPGRMGVPKLVLTSRKKNAGFTLSEEGPVVHDDQRGYWGVRFCVLTGSQKQCGVRKVTEWKKFPCPPVCEECLKVVDGVLKPAYFRRYPEIRDYFKWAEQKFKRGQPAPSVVWDASEGKVRVTRLRKCDEITAFCNNSFQAMLADIGKHAFSRMVREAYLGEREDGSRTPLLGARFPVFMHDEPISELLLETAHLSGPRIAEIAVESGKLLAPDVVWKAETAISHFLAKGMEPVYLCCGERTESRRCGKCGGDGKLVPWEPKGGWT